MKDVKEILKELWEYKSIVGFLLFEDGPEGIKPSMVFRPGCKQQVLHSMESVLKQENSGGTCSLYDDDEAFERKHLEIIWDRYNGHGQQEGLFLKDLPLEVYLDIGYLMGLVAKYRKPLDE